MDAFRSDTKSGSGWAKRSEFWRSFTSKSRGARKKFKFREPLIICGHGAHIRVELSKELPVRIDWRGRVSFVGNDSGSPYKRELNERQLKFILGD